MSRKSKIIASLIAVSAAIVIGTFAYQYINRKPNEEPQQQANQQPTNQPGPNQPGPTQPAQPVTPAGAPPATPVGAPPTTNAAPLPVALPPIPRAVDAIGDLIADLQWYKGSGKADGFLVSSQVIPFQIQIPVDFLQEDDQEAFHETAEIEINRTGKNRTIEALKGVRLILDTTCSRFESAIIFFEGEDAQGQPLNTQGTTSTVRIVLDSNIWTMSHSIQVAGAIRHKLHDTIGAPDRGEVRQYPLMILRDPLTNITD